MTCPICEHIKAESEKVERLLATTPRENFRRRGGLLTAQADWSRAWDLHKATCREKAA